jgi:hypothetical protein
MVTTGGFPLAGVELKRFWAGRYVDTLNRQVKQFLKDHRGKITDTYVPPQGGYMRFVDAPQSDPPDEWSQLLGDNATTSDHALTNLRGSRRLPGSGLRLLLHSGKLGRAAES